MLESILSNFSILLILISIIFLPPASIFLFIKARSRASAELECPKKEKLSYIDYAIMSNNHVEAIVTFLYASKFIEIKKIKINILMVNYDIVEGKANDKNKLSKMEKNIMDIYVGKNKSEYPYEQALLFYDDHNKNFSERPSLQGLYFPQEKQKEIFNKTTHLIKMHLYTCAAFILFLFVYFFINGYGSGENDEFTLARSICAIIIALTCIAFAHDLSNRKKLTNNGMELLLSQKKKNKHLKNRHNTLNPNEAALAVALFGKNAFRDKNHKKLFKLPPSDGDGGGE